MRVLLDECVSKRLAGAIVGHTVRTVVGEGWAGKKNGDLLRLMAASGFEVLITIDQNIPYQQNLARGPVAVVVLMGRSTRLADLLLLIPDVLRALASIRPGDLVTVRA